MSSGCGCKEVYIYIDFLILLFLYLHSSCICSFLQQHHSFFFYIFRSCPYSCQLGLKNFRS